MKYKLLAVDVDGTLLNSENKITVNTANKIREAVEKGIVFTISTGRPLQGVLPLVEELGFDFPLIMYNGALIMKNKEGEILYQNNLNSKNSINIYELGIKKDVTIIVWVDNKLYTNRFDKRSEKYSIQANTKPILIDDYKKLLSNGATKLLWYDLEDEIEKYDIELKNQLSKSITFHKSKPFYLEFVDFKSSKAIAMTKIGEYYNIKREEMIAIGDSYNDLSMIKYAGLGVSMGNAPYDIKKEANFITATNDNEGISYVIDKFIL